jgi:hypothetical protein
LIWFFVCPILALSLLIYDNRNRFSIWNCNILKFMSHSALYFFHTTSFHTGIVCEQLFQYETDMWRFGTRSATGWVFNTVAGA